MIITNKFKEIKFFFSIIVIFTLFFNVSLISDLYAFSFKITDIEVSEDFNLNFNKKRVFDKAFITAFDQLTSTVITSKDKEKIEKTNLSTIKSLIDSFNVSDEKFIEDKYIAKFNVYFNKKNAYKYFELKNIFPSVPKKLDLLILPILINNENDKVIFFSENPIYKKWNTNIEKYHLLNYVMPSEDIEDMQILKEKIDIIEEYNFDEIIKKYELKNYLILIINQSNNEINILSKIRLNNYDKIINNNFIDMDVYKDQQLIALINDLKTIYEDEWKKINLINTSIKLPLTISLAAKNYDKIELFEKALEDLDLVSNFIVSSFNSEEITFKITYNGSPDKFFNVIKDLGLNIEKDNQTLKIQ